MRNDTYTHTLCQTLAIALAFALAGFAASAPAAVIVVDTLADELNTDGDCSFREAMAAAQTNAASDACTAGNTTSNDLIIFTVNGTIPYSPAQPMAVTSGPLEISGNGPANLVLAGAGNSHFINVSLPSTRDFTLRGMRLTGGNGSGSNLAGAIEVNGGRNVTFEQVEFIDNEANGGGALYVNANLLSLTLRECLFDANRSKVFAFGGGGAMLIGARGAGSALPDDTLIEDCVLRDNSALGDGGAISINGDSAGGAGFDTVLVRDSVFDGNEAGAANTASAGGAVAIWRQGLTPVVQMERVRLLDNLAWGAGGAIRAGSGTLVTLADSLIVANRSQSQFGHGVSADSDASFGGGVVLLQRSTLLDTNPGGLALSAETGASGNGEIEFELSVISTGGASDCGPDGTLRSNGGNVMSDTTCPSVTSDASGVDPQLDALLDPDGYPLPVPRAPGVSIDRLACAAGTDVRGVVRPQDADGLGPSGQCDAGAVERREGRLLTVNRAGSGTGTVTSVPSGINCGTACISAFDLGSAVQLVATAAPGSSFAGWTGSCTGTGNCSVTMSAQRNVTATFNTAAVTFDLTVQLGGDGRGTVSSDPSGINCPDACLASFASGNSVTLTAIPAPGDVFIGWSSDCSASGSNPVCTVSMTAARLARAVFREDLLLANGFE